MTFGSILLFKHLGIIPVIVGNYRTHPEHTPRSEPVVDTSYTPVVLCPGLDTDRRRRSKRQRRRLLEGTAAHAVLVSEKWATHTNNSVYIVLYNAVMCHK